VFLPVVDVLSCNAAHEGVTGIAIGQETADGEQHLGDGQGGAPLVLEDVQADHTLGVHVAMINSCAELDFGWLKGVICGEMDVEEENSPFINGSRGTQDGANPLIEVVPLGAGTAIWRRIQGYSAKLFLNSFGRSRQCLGHFWGSFLFFGLIWCFTLAG